MHSWDWFDEYEWRAQTEGDEDRLPLGYLHREAYRFRESDPDHALALIAQGRALAERLREPWWVLYYDQQRVHALLHFKQDYRDVLDLAVRNTLEVRKAAYVDFPRRLMIHGDLVSAYLGIDPVGYAEPIRQALDYLDQETPSEGDDRYLVLGSRRQFALDRGRLEEAEQYSQRSLELAAADSDRGRASHFLVFTYSGLCEIAWRKSDWEMLANACEVGEEMAQLVGHKVELAGFWMWQALVHLRRGVAGRAEQLSRRAVRRLEGLGMPPDSSFRDAECAYHEGTGALDRALLAREAELAQLQGRGRLALECASLTQRAWLLHKLGRLEEADLARCLRASERLRKPGPALERIERIQRGEAP